MTDRKPWHCPSCNAYHGPHVDTCPKPMPAMSVPFMAQPNTAGQLTDALRYAQNTAAATGLVDYTTTVVR